MRVGLFGLVLLFCYQALSSVQPERVIYFSADAAQRAIKGRPFNFGLGGKEYRKSFDELELSIDEKQNFQSLSEALKDYPNAVVSRGVLYFKSDDNCTVIKDSIDGVDISEACRTHDYCYRNVAALANDSKFRARFAECNLKFKENMVALCKEAGKKCSISKIYAAFVQRVSFIAFRFQQSRQAKMVKFLLEESQNDFSSYALPNFFNLEEMVKNYEIYCRRIAKKIKRRQMLYPSEKSACQN